MHGYSTSRGVDTANNASSCECHVTIDCAELILASSSWRRHSVRVPHELLQQVDTFPYLRSLITEDDECTTEFRTR